MSKEGFIIYKSFYEPIKYLSDKQLGRLFRALFDYQIEGSTQVDSDLQMAFAFFKNQMDIDDSKYQKVIERNKQNGSKGGRPPKEENPKNPMGLQKPKKADKEKDNENDKDNDKEKKYKEELFVRFWDLYDKKSDRQDCLKKWMKLNESEIEKILSVVKSYVDSTPNVQYRKHPKTWLNGKCWEDEIIIPKSMDVSSKLSIPMEQNQW